MVALLAPIRNRPGTAITIMPVFPRGQPSSLSFRGIGGGAGRVDSSPACGTRIGIGLLQLRFVLTHCQFVNRDIPRLPVQLHPWNAPPADAAA